MSRHLLTLWYKGFPSPKLLTEGFEQAGQLTGLTPRIVTAKGNHPNSQDAWAKRIEAESVGQMLGEVRWILESKTKSIKGAISWPTFDAPYMPKVSVLQSGFYWKPAKPEKIKSYSFSNHEVLCKFLHVLATATAAATFWVETSPVPHALVISRYGRFQRLADRLTLHYPDWIFGLRNSDPQFPALEGVRDQFHLISPSDDFTIFLLTEEPLDYTSPENMQRLAVVETALGLDP